MLREALATIYLHRFIDDLEQGVRHHDLALRDGVPACFIALQVHGVCRVQHDKPHGVDAHAHVGDALDVAVELADELPAGFLARLVAADEGKFVRALGLPDEPHAVMDAAWAETPLCDFEGAAGPKDYVLAGDADVLVEVFAVAFGGPVVAHYGEVADLCEARGVCGNDESCVSVPGIFVGRVGASHEDEDLHLVVVLAVAV